MIAEKKYLKKIPILNENSSAEARAKRLRRLRNMANLTREQMCEQGLMNINTYKGWEIARYGGLPLDGAERVLARIAAEGIICSLDWLLHEIGTGPQISQSFSNAEVSEHSVMTHSYDQLILNEILLFRSQFKDAIDFKVDDDGLQPFYYSGDFVAGIKYCGEDISKLIGEFCITQRLDGKIITRQVLKGNRKNCFTLACSNLEATVKSIEPDVELAFAARIIRHYRGEGD